MLTPMMSANLLWLAEKRLRMCRTSGAAISNRREGFAALYGMAGVDGVRKSDHLGFISLEGHREFQYLGDFACSYVKKPKSVHSKIYVWCRGEIPVRAFIGSANYSETGFNSVSRTETLAGCDPASALDFFWETKKATVPCAKANRDKDFPPEIARV